MKDNTHKDCEKLKIIAILNVPQAVKKESLKNSGSVETEFQPMTSAISLHCSTDRVTKATGNFECEGGVTFQFFSYWLAPQKLNKNT